MDSFTQILLGAACGEVVAGKKMGNRAMLWGAVGGTIPDLDVLATFFTDEITATAFHRGFMHSFLFAALAPWPLAKLAGWFYNNNIHRRQGYKTVAASAWLLLYIGAAVGINLIPVALGNGLSWKTLALTLLLGILLAFRLWRDYLRRDLAQVHIPEWTWFGLFFWSIFTHPILDCFTNWGTQIWQPFSDLRVQWNAISVVDPLCSLPFSAALLVASRCLRHERRRQIWTLLGLAWFCGYILIYACWHKWQANRAFEQSLKSQNIHYQRFMTLPTIFNNIVWAGVAEGDTAFYMGLMGFNDCRQEFWRIHTVPKNHEKITTAVSPDDRQFKFVQWFTNGYWNVVERPDGHLQINDLRFGLLGDTIRGPQSYVFPFVVDELRDGHLKIHHDRNVEESKRSFPQLWTRFKGVCPD